MKRASGIGIPESEVKSSKRACFHSFRKPETWRLQPAALGSPLAHALQRIVLESLPEEEVT